MKKTTKFLLRAIAFVLTLSMFLSIPMVQPALAEVAQDKTLAKQYLAEIKMFYGRDEKTARASCESEGYIFCPTDLNEGGSKLVLKDEFQSPEDGKPIAMYMGYKTTEDPDEAITDITLLDMKYTHFEEMSYKEFLDAHISDFKNEAGQLMVLVADFRQKVEAESPNALMALDSLNLFYVDEAKSHDAAENLFGNYLLKEADITEDDNSDVGHVGEVDTVEQQIQYSQQKTEEQQPPKTKKRTFVGKQHIHLILPDRQADIIKQLAKMTGVSVNQFMSQAIDILYEERWKPVVEVLEQNRHKLGLDKRTDKNLFN